MLQCVAVCLSVLRCVAVGVHSRTLLRKSHISAIRFDIYANSETFDPKKKIPCIASVKSGDWSVCGLRAHGWYWQVRR